MNLRTLGPGIPLAFLAPAGVLLAATLAAAPNPVGVLTEKAKLTGIGDARGDRYEAFGSAVAADGDTLVVGAPGHDLPVRDQGAAYVFVRTGGVWTLEAKLSPSDPATDARFGHSVAISGDTVVVGSGGFYASEVYVFVRTGGVWTEEGQLTGSDTEGGDGFGQAVSISADTVVVGAPEDTTGFGFRSGSAYVFVRNGGLWTEQQKLLPADLAGDDHFGQTVSVSVDSLVAGSPNDDTGTGIDAGSAYVFVRTGGVWAQESKLMAPTGAADDNFGSAASLDGDSVVVGAPGEDASAVFNAGAAYVFVRTGSSWSLEQRIVLAPSNSFQWFGAAVALESGTLIVGAPGEEESGVTGAGAAHVFLRTGTAWSEEQRLTGSVPETFEGFGLSLGLSGDVALVGSPNRDDGSGSAYVFRRVGSTWSDEARLDPPGTASFDAVGSAIALEGDVLVVGAPNDDLPAGRRAGSAYVFVRRGAAWTLQQKIVASDATINGGFGSAVALSGDTLVVGAPQVSFPEGAAYVFALVGGVWQEQQKLVPAVRSAFAFFGSALSLDGNSLIVGAPREEESGAFEAGAAYVFVRIGSTWSMEQRLVSSVSTGSAAAGSSVAIAGDTALVGVPNDPAGGAVVEFRRVSGLWAQAQVISPSDGASGDWFGQALVLSADTLIVGSPQKAFGAGAAYVFVRAGGPWTEQQKLADAIPQLRQFGTAVAVAGDTALIAPRSEIAGPSGGEVLLFERAGATWTQRQRVTASDGTQSNRFGQAVALSGGTAAVGAPGSTTSVGLESGAAYVLVPAVADLSLGMVGSPASVVQGDLVTFMIVASNNGPDAAPVVGVISTLDPGLVVDSASASQGTCTVTVSVACDLGVVPAGGTATVTVVAAAVGVGIQASQASIVWAGSDPVPGNETGSVSTTVGAGGPADVSVAKFGFSPTAAVGSSIGYGIDVTNQGPATAAGVVVQDPTPPGLTLVQVSGACSSGFPCVLSRIPSGETRIVFALFTIPASYPGPDPVVNTATVTTATPDPVASNDASTVQTPFFVPGGNLDFHTVTPCRILDTRDVSQGGTNPLSAGSTQSFFPAYAPCGVSFSARAVAVNVTVTQPTATGNLRLYPSGLPVPQVSTINYSAGQTRGSNGVVSLGENGGLAVYVGQASGTVHVILDVFGYFQ